MATSDLMLKAATTLNMYLSKSLNVFVKITQFFPLSGFNRAKVNAENSNHTCQDHEHLKYVTKYDLVEQVKAFSKCGKLV